MLLTLYWLRELVTFKQSCSTWEGEKGRLLTGECLGVELLTSARMKDLLWPLAKWFMEWLLFARRMTNGAGPHLEPVKDFGKAKESWLNMALLKSARGCPSGLHTLLSVFWSCGVLSEGTCVGEAFDVSENSKLLRSPHDDRSWKQWGKPRVYERVHIPPTYFKKLNWITNTELTKGERLVPFNWVWPNCDTFPKCKNLRYKSS